MVKAVRGAVQVDSDDKNVISSEISRMVEQIITLNNIEIPNIVSLFFTVTSDLKSVNPAAALRAGGGYEEVPLFCAQEPDTQEAMKRVIRVLLTCENVEYDQKMKHVYLGGAAKLRPDLS